jgi:hypothetical protein
MTRDQLAQAIIDYLAASDEDDLYTHERSPSEFIVDGAFDPRDLADTILAAGVYAPEGEYIDVVFDGSPGPVTGRFVEVEDQQEMSINAGKWIDRGNGLWALRIQKGDIR